MSEPRKNHLNIDGAQVKEDDRVDSYKPIPESAQEFRSSKASLGKSKEKVSDPAEERLLTKEDEAKIVTRVDMPAEAKYVVGDHRNGDAKIELDANKRQFSGLTKEELLKYADDPFWVRLRWFMFVLFWALWVGMLAGAIIIIIRAPKCAPPTPKTWYEIGPLVDYYSDSEVDYATLQSELPLLEEAKVQGIFINPCANTYDVLESPTCIDNFKAFLEKAKQKSIKVIVDLTANFVSTSHKWFQLSANRTEEFKDYFVWADMKDYEGAIPKPPYNWVTVYDEPAWSLNEARQQFYLHQYGADQADLNFHLPAVVGRFDQVLAQWLAAGADGIRLRKVRQLLVDTAFKDEEPNPAARSAVVGQYGFLRHTQTADQPHLDHLIAKWSQQVADSGEEKVFTIHEDGSLQPEWYRLRAHNSSLLRPPSAAPLLFSNNMTQLALQLDQYSANWTALQLSAEDAPTSSELRSLTALLPVTPLLSPAQIFAPTLNETDTSSLSHLFALRNDASIKYGARAVAAVSAVNSTTQLIAVARWKAGGIAYVAVFNPSWDPERANLTALPSLPHTLTVTHVTHSVKLITNYTTATSLAKDDVLVPGRSSVVLSYVPNTAAEQ